MALMVVTQEASVAVRAVHQWNKGQAKKGRSPAGHRAGRGVCGGRAELPQPRLRGQDLE